MLLCMQSTPYATCTVSAVAIGGKTGGIAGMPQPGNLEADGCAVVNETSCIDCILARPYACSHNDAAEAGREIPMYTR